MKSIRIKKKCGKCEYWTDFPYVHCLINCKMKFRMEKKKKLIRECLGFQ